MIRGALNGKDGRPVLMIGLTPENLARLQADEPIGFTTAGLVCDAGMPLITVIIGYGASEQDLIDELVARGVINERTAVTDLRGQAATP